MESLTDELLVEAYNCAAKLALSPQLLEAEIEHMNLHHVMNGFVDSV